MSRFVGSSVLRGGSSISLQLPPLPLPRWWSLVLAQLEPGRKEAREAEGSDTNPRGDAFYGDGRLVEACRHVQRSRRRVGSRDRSPRRTPTEITGSRNRRDTPPHNGYLRDGKGVSAMYRRHRRSHLVVPASCATHQDFAASFDRFCRFSFVCREKAGNKSKL